MIDLTGPPRAWPDGLICQFGKAYEAAEAAGRGTGQADPALLERLAELFGADPERTTVTGGVRRYATRAATGTRRVIIERPTFCDIPMIFGRESTVHRASWNRLPDLAKSISGRAVFWVTSPSRNPDGRSLSGDEARALAAIAAQGHEVVVNQVYRWFTPRGEIPQDAWCITSFSKLCGGRRGFGWLTRPAARPAVDRTHEYGPSLVWQRAWARFLSASALRCLIAACAEPTVASAQAFAARAGELLGWDLGYARFSAVLVGPGMSEEDMLGLFADAGLRVSPGSAFDMPAASVRIAFSGVTVPEARIAAERVARLAGAAPAGSRIVPWKECACRRISAPIPQCDCCSRPLA